MTLFTWTTDPALDATTVAELGLDTEFPDQASAEAWFTEHWIDLDDAGVESVSLLHGTGVVYGPMPLSA